MSQWISLGSIDQFESGSSVEMVAANRILAVFKVNQDFFVLDGICAHQGGPLGKGQLCDKVVTCPWHGWQYDVTSGKHQLSEIHQESYNTKVQEDELFILIDNNTDSSI